MIKVPGINTISVEPWFKIRVFICLFWFVNDMAHMTKNNKLIAKTRFCD